MKNLREDASAYLECFFRNTCTALSLYVSSTGLVLLSLGYALIACAIFCISFLMLCIARFGIPAYRMYQKATARFEAGKDILTLTHGETVGRQVALLRLQKKNPELLEAVLPKFRAFALAKKFNKQKHKN